MIPLLIFLIFNFFLSLENETSSYVPLRNFSTIVYFYQELHINYVKIKIIIIKTSFKILEPRVTFLYFRKLQFLKKLFLNKKFVFHRYQAI